MQALGTQTESQQVETFFKHIGHDPKLFTDQNALAVVLTFIDTIGREPISEPPAKIKYNGVEYFKHDDLLDMPLKFLVELVNIDLNYETFEFAYAVTALMYRRDWTKPFNKNEYLEGQKRFFDAPFIYSLYSIKLFGQLILSLQESYPILYKGEQKEENDGRKMYGLIRGLGNNNFTNMEVVESMEIWRAWTWMEEVRLDEINKKNEQ